MNKENYYKGTRYFKCRSCGLMFKESFIIDKDTFAMELNQVKTPSVSIHKRCINAFHPKGFHPNGERYYGIGELIGIGVIDFEENTNGE